MRIGRRGALVGLVSVFMTPRRAFSRSAAIYSVVAQPAQALIGDRLRLELRCQASEATEVTTFEDASLALGMARRTAQVEPALAFPNRKAVQAGARLIRLAPVARRRLQSGEYISRQFDLVSVFPRLALDSGLFRVHYEIDYGGQSQRVGPANVTIESGPPAIPGLLTLLSHDDLDVRERAAGLVHRMTAQVVGYSAEADVDDRNAAARRWGVWWERIGTKLPWNFQSVGATFGDATLLAPRRRRSKVIGGIAYRRESLRSGDATAIASALVEWLRDPARGPAALRGRERIADQTVHYPSDDTMIEPDGEMVSILGAALSRLAETATSVPSDSSAAMLSLATVAKMPDGRFVPPLEALRAATSKSPAWRRVSFVAGGLLDVLDPSRTPVGDP